MLGRNSVGVDLSHLLQIRFRLPPRQGQPSFQA
jgi:hypothetical protein